MTDSLFNRKELLWNKNSQEYLPVWVVAEDNCIELIIMIPS